MTFAPKKQAPISSLLNKSLVYINSGFLSLFLVPFFGDFFLLLFLPDDNKRNDKEKKKQNLKKEIKIKKKTKKE